MYYVASVDYETNRKIQDTIATESKERIILCIARTFLLGRSPVLRWPSRRSFAHGPIIWPYLRSWRWHGRRECPFFCAKSSADIGQWTRNTIPRRTCSTFLRLPSHWKISEGSGSLWISLTFSLFSSSQRGTHPSRFMPMVEVCCSLHNPYIFYAYNTVAFIPLWTFDVFTRWYRIFNRDNVSVLLYIFLVCWSSIFQLSVLTYNMHIQNTFSLYGSSSI